MAHELYLMADGTYAMARAADTEPSWHRLENVIPADAPFETWLDRSGMDFRIHSAPAEFTIDGIVNSVPDRKVLYRSDTQRALSVVSNDYNIVQPTDVLNFFRELCEKYHLKMDTAGVIRGGVKFWALASTGVEINVGTGVDHVKQYILLASSADASMATTAKHTTKRVVCSNTFHASVNNGEAAIRVSHARAFDANEVKINLGLLSDEFENFGVMASTMHDARVTDMDARRWYAEMFSGKTDLSAEDVDTYASSSRLFKGAFDSFQKAPGAEQTIWGLFNGITHMVDHTRGRTVDSKLDSSMFGAGVQLKQVAWKKALATV